MAAADSKSPWGFTVANILQIVLIVVAGLVFGVRLEGRVKANEHELSEVKVKVDTMLGQRFDTGYRLGRLDERTDQIQRRMDAEGIRR